MGSETQKLAKKLDRLFSEYIRRAACEDGWGKCYTCGAVKPYEQLDAGHYISRRHMATRWNVLNCQAQCRGCNRFRHGEPIAFREHLVEDYGDDAVKELERARHEVRQWTLEELEQAIERFQAELITFAT